VISRLELAARVREGEVFAGRATRTERHYLDFVIDGKSLWQQLKKPDMVSILCFEYAAAAPHESFKAGIACSCSKKQTTQTIGARFLFVPNAATWAAPRSAV
jgi:hypothetical protein